MTRPHAAHRANLRAIEREKAQRLHLEGEEYITLLPVAINAGVGTTYRILPDFCSARLDHIAGSYKVMGRELNPFPDLRITGLPQVGPNRSYIITGPKGQLHYISLNVTLIEPLERSDL